MKENREKYAPRLKLTTDDEDLLQAGSGSGPVEGSGDGGSDHCRAYQYIKMCCEVAAAVMLLL